MKSANYKKLFSFLHSMESLEIDSTLFVPIPTESKERALK